MAQAKYTMDDLRFRRGERWALAGVTAELRAGELVAVCGLNGAGKSTLLGCLAGLLTGYSGACRFQGREVNSWGKRELAKAVSFLPQQVSGEIPFTGEEVVRMGRYPFGGGWREQAADKAICARAVELADCEALLPRSLEEMSGGERQRVLLAAVLAQQPEALLLDEPGTYVDVPHQVKIFRTLRELTAGGLLCLAATHDLNLAAAFCHRVLLLDGGQLVADGPPRSVFTGPEFARVFGDSVAVSELADGKVQVHYGA